MSFSGCLSVYCLKFSVSCIICFQASVPTFLFVEISLLLTCIPVWDYAHIVYCNMPCRQGAQGVKGSKDLRAVPVPDANAELVSSMKVIGWCSNLYIVG